MVARPGKLQAAFNSGELGPKFYERSELKYFSTGLARAENIEISPQGGFAVRMGLRHVGETHATAQRLVDFKASNGAVYDLALNDANIEVWGQSSKVHQFGHTFSAGQVAQVNSTQLLDTLLLFHMDQRPQRAIHKGPTDWTIADMPINRIPTHDYGDVYANGVAAVWELDFIGFKDSTSLDVREIAFTLTVGGQETRGILANGGTGVSENFERVPTAAAIQAAVLALPNVAPGITCVGHATDSTKCVLTFTGTGNLHDRWTLSARVLNKVDAACIAFKSVPGVEPGEDIISATRGWPRCGVFFGQRLLMGGFRSLPNSWMASIVGDYFNFDQRLNEANGSFVVPMDIAGGEAIEQLVNNRNLLVMTSDAEYWISDRALSKTTPPVHVQASRHGTAHAVPVVENEGAALFIHGRRDVLGEFRYTDVDGNFTATNISLLGYHLVNQAVDQAVRKAEGSQSGATVALLQADGQLRFVTLLREQEVTAFGRVTSPATFRATACNGRNELTVIAERAKGASTSRRIERFEPGLLLDGAITITQAPAVTVSGLGVHEGQSVWALADGHVFGPFTVEAGIITLPIEAASITVGRWSPPVATTLPLPREVGPQIVVQRLARIHTVNIMVEDTTSLALAANGGRVFDVPLQRYGMLADVPELDAGVTALIKLSGFTGYQDQPQLTITQVRPGRLTVRSVTVEASL